MSTIGKVTEINEFSYDDVSWAPTELNDGKVASSSPLDLSSGVSIETDNKAVFAIEKRLGCAEDNGESDVYLCSRNGNKFVAKIYRRIMDSKQKADRKELIRKLNDIKNERVAKIIDFGFFGDRFFEIYNYFSSGSLANEAKKRRFGYEELRNTIIPGIADALNSLHGAGLYHRDLKPSNIMWRDSSKKDIVLIDFGISEILKEGETTKLLSRISGTPQYRAPEIANGFIFGCSDYFSFGVVIYELFCGEPPIGVQINIIPKPSGMSDDLYDLFCGLTFRETANRQDENNPENRWTYNKVMSWLKGEPVRVPGRGHVYLDINDRSIPKFSWQEKVFDNVDELCLAFGMDWENGKKCIMRGNLLSHLTKTEQLSPNQALWVSQIRDITEGKYNPDQKLIRIIQGLSPSRSYIACPLGFYKTPYDFGKRLFECLECDSTVSLETAISSIELLAEVNHISIFMQTEKGDEKDIELIQSVENEISADGAVSERWEKQPSLILYELAFLLTKKPLDLELPNGETFDTLDSFRDFLITKGSGDFGDLYGFCNKYILDDVYSLKPKIYGWIASKRCDLQLFNRQDGKKKDL